MGTRARVLCGLALACAVATGAALAAIPVGYRYVGSRLVSEGRVVYWYWNADVVDISADGTTFVARMYARAVDVGQERPYVAEIRCDTRTYREFGSIRPFQAIDEGEPIQAVWRAGCRDGRAVTLAERNARLGIPAAPADAAAAVPARVAGSPVPTPAPAPATPAAPTAVAAAKDGTAADPRRADSCVRFSETKGAPAGDATVTNTCAFPVEVTLCYKGARGGIYDCPAPPKGKRSESLRPGATLVLPEYRRARHSGVALVACRGVMGSVFPRLDDAGGGTGCF
ncbi:MAG: hypothetical protein U1F58_04855 [Burkholderiales bacterium]